MRSHLNAVMFVLVRALTYATLFVALVLIVLPARVLSASGIVAPTTFGPLQFVGMLLGAAGAALALSCVLAFAFVGKGTPAPFDPPRRLVARGPYRIIRNPMYVGAACALAGAALFYQSFALVGYLLAFVLITHLFVIAYEEPTLRRMFGSDYDAYCEAAGRWWPRPVRSFGITIHIAAPPERVWQVMSDVERWHEWTSSVTSVKLLDTGPLAVGSRAVIRQPKFPPARWTVTALDPGRSFTWISHGPGFRAVAQHEVVPTTAGSRATLSIELRGVFGGVFGRLTKNITDRYLAFEANGLKARSENPPSRSQIPLPTP